MTITIVRNMDGIVERIDESTLQATVAREEEERRKAQKAKQEQQYQRDLAKARRRRQLALERQAKATIRQA